MIEPTYERLISINSNYLIAYHKNNYGIIDINNTVLLDFAYSKIFTPLKNFKLCVEDRNGIYFSFNIKTKELEKLPFDKLLGASSNTYAATPQEGYSYYKSICDCTETDEWFHALELVKYKGKWGIVDADGTVLIPNDYDYIDCLRNPNYFKVCKGDLKFKEGEEDYKLTVDAPVKWGIIDLNNKVIVPIEYDWIDEVEDTIWAVHKGGTVYYDDDYQQDYWTIQGGKLGVYNLDKLITPVAYDALMTNWFRVKDYIFVQNGVSYFDDTIQEYDVYTFDGRKLERNKPKPNDHINYS